MRHLGFALLLCAAAFPAAAQDYPSKPVRVVMAYAPGGPTDFISRVISEKLQQKFGQPFLVESKPGANLRIGTDFVAKSAPDGYTIGVTGVPHATNPALFPNMPYDTLKDLAGLAHLVDAPLVLSVPAASPLKTVADLIAISAKAGELFLHGELPLGEGHLQSAEDYVRTLSATSGLPFVMVRRNMQKIHHALTNMRVVLNGLTRGLPLEVIDTGTNGVNAGSRVGRGGGGGRGLRGMRERAAAYGGELEAGPMAQGGWRVHFSLSADTAKR